MGTWHTGDVARYVSTGGANWAFIFLQLAKNISLIGEIVDDSSWDGYMVDMRQIASKTLHL